MKTFIALLSVSLIALAVAQYGTGVYPTSTTNASVSTWTTGCAYVTSWTSTPPFAYCGGCATGYFQSTTQSTCTAISPAGCAAISSNNTCLAVLPGYYNASGILTQCPASLTGTVGSGTCTSSSTVTTCAPGFWLATGATACSACTIGSSPAAALSGCTQCDPSGSGACISVGAAASVAGSGATATTASPAAGFIANCFITSGNTGTITCTTPNPGYYGTGLATVTLATPITGCLQYTSNTVCSKTILGYQLNSSGNVVPCTNISTTTTCSGAASGYYVNGSATTNGTAIVALPAGVATGTGTVNYTCMTGYYLTQTGLCVSGTLTDTHCAIANSTSVCVGCQAGYNFTTNLTCGACTGSNCASCSNATNCTACTNTTLYTLQSNGTCTNKTSSANILAPSFAILSMIFYYLF